jgi:hypothetical protein
MNSNKYTNEYYKSKPQKWGWGCVTYTKKQEDKA